MKKLLLLFIVVICFPSCNRIDLNPVIGAKDFCDEMSKYTKTSDVNNANNCLNLYWDTYSKSNKLEMFCIALRDLFRSSRYHHVGVFIGNIDKEKYPLFNEFMVHFIKVNKDLDKSHLKNTIDKIGRFSLFDGFGEGHITYSEHINEVKLICITNVINKGQLKVNKQLAIEGLKIALSGDSLLLQQMVEAETSFSFWVSDGAEKFEVAKFSTNDIKEIMNNPIQKSKRKDLLLKNYIDKTNSILPNQIAEGVTYQKVEIKGDYIVQKYIIDENIYNIKEIEAVLKVHKNDIVSDPIERNEYDIYSSHGKGLRIEYYSSGKQPVFVISYTPTDLKKLL